MLFVISSKEWLLIPFIADSILLLNLYLNLLVGLMPHPCLGETYLIPVTLQKVSLLSTFLVTLISDFNYTYAYL